MLAEYTAVTGSDDFFLPARQGFETLLMRLQSSEFATADLGALERDIQQNGYEILRRLLQGRLDLQASQEPRLPFVID